MTLKAACRNARSSLPPPAGRRSPQDDLLLVIEEFVEGVERWAWNSTHTVELAAVNLVYTTSERFMNPAAIPGRLADLDAIGQAACHGAFRA